MWEMDGIVIILLCAFFVMGFAGGATLVYMLMKDRVERLAVEHAEWIIHQQAQEAAQASLVRARKLAERKRSFPARDDAGPPARLHKAKHARPFIR